MARKYREKPLEGELPTVLVWHERAPSYRRALLRELPDVPLEARRPNDDSGPWPAIEAALIWKPPEGGLRDLPDLRWIHVAGAGVDHLLGRDDLAPGVAVTRSRGRFGVQAAEYVVGHLLALLLDVDGYEADRLARRWRPRRRPLLADATVLVLGLGKLGRAIASRLAAFGTRVRGVRRRAKPVTEVDRVLGEHEWRRHLPECDVLVIALPLTGRTAGLVGAEELAALPDDAILVNVGRGEIVDEDSLLHCLEAGRLGGAVLDAFRREPLPPEHPLWRRPDVRITPHVAAPSEVEPIAREFAANYRKFVADEPLAERVDRERGY